MSSRTSAGQHVVACAGGLTLALAVALPRTRLGGFGNLLAVVVPSVVVVVLRLDDVAFIAALAKSQVCRPDLASVFGHLARCRYRRLAVAAVILVRRRA